MRNDLAKNDSNLGKDSLSDHESPRYGAAGALQDFVEMKKSKGWDYRLTPVENAGEIRYTEEIHIHNPYHQNTYERGNLAFLILKNSR